MPNWAGKMTIGFLGSDAAAEEEEEAAMTVVVVREDGGVVVVGRRKAKVGVGAWSRTDNRRRVIRIMMAGSLQVLALIFLLCLCLCLCL